MKDWLAAQTTINPNKIFLNFQSETYTYAQLNQESALWAGRLQALGIKKRDVVAVLLSNSVEYVAITFAVMRLGAVLLPLNTRLTKEELEYQLAQADATLLLTSTTLKEDKAVESTLCFTLEQKFPEVLPVFENNISFDSRFCILFTSGTTGKPKAVCLSLKNFYFSANASAYRLGVMPNDNWLCAMPLYHVGGLSILLRSCLYGTSVTLHPKFDLQAVTRELSEDVRASVTIVSLVPTMLYRILNQDDFKPSVSLRLVLLGGAAASQELLELAQDIGVKVVATYGLSEACSQVATVFPEACYDKVETVGKPLVFTEVKIVDEQGIAVASSKVGEVQVRGPTVMEGYLGQSKDVEEWFSTGDMGYLDADGDLFIKQRRSDLIVSGGENVYPAEVEAVLRQSQLVKDVVVFALEHPEWGQQVAAAVVVQENVTLDEAEKDMRQRCEGQLAGYKQPKGYFETDSFPMTASGKVKRLELPQHLKLS